MSTRQASILLAALTIPVGLYSRHLKLRHPELGDILGDSLYATMAFFVFGIVFPRVLLTRRALLAFAFSTAVELSQLYHRPWIDRLRAKPLGGILLGSTFDARDILCYAGGVVAAVAVFLVLIQLSRKRQF